MKKIGFVDYYISEWHANNYPGWIAKANEALGYDFEVAYAWAERDVSPVDGVTTAQWCEKYGAERCSSVKELCEKSDCVIILAPSNPEKHLEYAAEVFKYGKRTYIDKTFAPSLDEAEKIFALAEQYGVQFFSTSALRYAKELDGVENCRALVTVGGGRTLEEYVIHQVEMAVKAIPSEPVALKIEAQGKQRIWTVKFEKGESWTGVYVPNSSFNLALDDTYKAVSGGFFNTLIAEIVRFFETGVLPFDTNETLKAMKIRDAILTASIGEWKDL
jgi:hypothetical protein